MRRSTSAITLDELHNSINNESELPLRFSNALRQFRLGIPYDTPSLGDFERHPSRVGKVVSQEELAEALDVTRSWYATLESKTPARPSIALLHRLCCVLGLNKPQSLLLIVLGIPELSAFMS